jgi:hypothetical protein
VSAFGGLFCGYLAWHAVHGLSQSDWIFSIVGAVIAYGVGAALVPYFLSDLIVQPKSALSGFPQAQK